MLLTMFLTVSLARAEFPYTQQARELPLKREHTGLGYQPETSIERILEYVRSKRGGTKPLKPDREKPDQLVLTDAQGKKWTAETDGGAVELKDPRGRMPFVFETKCKWFTYDERDRNQLSLESLIAAGAVPTYEYGGGHIHIKLKPWFVDHPEQFASLVNLALTYEPLFTHLFSHQRRVENARPLAITRLPGGQTLSDTLGNGLNHLLDESTTDCADDASLAPYLKKESRPGLTAKQNCILAYLARFGTEVVPDRTFAINLQSWRGAHSPLKLHDSLELRFFNAATNAHENELEEQLVRVMADRAIRGPVIRYVQKVAPYYDIDSYFFSYHPEEREGQFRELLSTLGFDETTTRDYLTEYLDLEKHARRRTTQADAP